MNKRDCTPIILAAGASTRMGRPKALLEFGEATAIELVIATCRRAAGGDPIIVLGHEADDIIRRLPTGSRVVLNAKYESGQTSSLKAGMRSLPPDCSSFLIFPVDCPLVRAETINLLIAAQPAIAIPEHDGRRGHPARVASTLIDELLALRDDEPAHTVIRRDPTRVTTIQVDDPGAVLKLNTLDDYAQAIELHRKRQATG